MYRVDVDFKRELKLPFNSHKIFLACKSGKFLTIRNKRRKLLQLAGANKK
jgi:hypothetical protein